MRNQTDRIDKTTRKVLSKAEWFKDNARWFIVGLWVLAMLGMLLWKGCQS